SSGLDPARAAAIADRERPPPGRPLYAYLPRGRFSSRGARVIVGPVKGFSLLFEALVAGPAKRRPLRAVLPVAGGAWGVAALASIPPASGSIPDPLRGAAGTVAGGSVFGVPGAGGVPVAALASFSFLWDQGPFAPAVTGSAVAADGSGEILQ